MARKKANKSSGLVYSTESGTIMCPECNKQKQQCVCRQKQTIPKDGIVRLMRETKGRKGKGVTLINGVALDPSGLKKLAKSLKQKCGSGGSVKNGVIEVQGDHRDTLEKELSIRGHKVKRAGG